MSFHRLIFPLAVLALPLSGAAYAEEDFDLPEKIQFNRDVRTIFSKTCFACHGPDGNTREAGIRLDVRETAIAKKDDFHPIVPGNAEASKGYQLLMSDDPDERMPPPEFHTQLTDREKAIMKKWIDQGAEYEKHWAFIPPVKATLPDVDHVEAVRNPIDNFVIAKLEAQGLAPAAEADRRTLIRRVSFDLTGMPPTPEEVSAFVNDPSDDAYEQVVDRLLASPRFGEHRARFWLDAARYADTGGYQYDKIRHQWVWRDWVIHAFNSNMPFDQFTLEQTAGDLLPNATDQTRLATGFHRNHPITIEGGVIDEEYRTEYVMDRVVTTTTTWMGLTFTCARCHDHKYDPIGQDDFYSFFAFFNSVPERGLNGFDPKETIQSPLAGTESAGLKAKLAAAQKQLGDAMAKSQSLVGTWEESLRKQADVESKGVQIGNMSAAGGTILTPQEDGSVLATGPNPDTQNYQINFTLGETATRAIRLEALTDASLPNKSTGRAHNGNFVLSEIKIDTAPAGDADPKWVPVKIRSAEADYEQNGYSVSKAIDGSMSGGWAIDGNSRAQNSSAVFTLDRELPKGSQVRVQLIHKFGTAHCIGRFRLSVPADGQAPLPASVRATLVKNRVKRNEAEQSALTLYLVQRFGGPELQKLTTKIDVLQSQIAAANVKMPETMILREMPKPRQAYVMMRGEYDKPLKDRPVTPNVPQALGGLPKGVPKNRLGLGQWLVSRENPLTARVTVNRFWSQIFGTGIVKTIEDFGSQGEYPTHPELLDWLSVAFMDSKWNTKQLFKAIVMSGTYRQSSHITPEIHARDPQNRLLAHGPRFRLDAEAIRDSALAVSGLLDERLGGPSVYPYHPEGLWLEINNRPGFSRAYPHTEEASQLFRRSMYTFWKRTVAPPSMATFDAPEREYCVVARSKTNTPLQAFVMLHDPQFVEAARKLAERMILEGGDDSVARISYGFELCVSRPPGEKELQILQKSLDVHLAEFKSSPDAASRLLSIGSSPKNMGIETTELAAYTNVARMLLNLSEFLTKG